MEVSISLYTSTESNCDVLYVYLGKQLIAQLSGERSGNTYYLTVEKGDELKITYQKDGSVANGNDTVSVYNFNYTLIEEEAA